MWYHPLARNSARACPWALVLRKCRGAPDNLERPGHSLQGISWRAAGAPAPCAGREPSTDHALESELHPKIDRDELRPHSATPGLADAVEIRKCREHVVIPRFNKR